LAAVGSQQRMHGGGWTPAVIQLVALILHERDQRRDQQGRAGEQNRRQLKPERLAGSGRHHGQHVVAVQHSADQIFLSGTERRVTEMLLERCAKIHPRHRRWHRRRWMSTESSPPESSPQRRMIPYAANGFSSAVGPYTDGTD